jgi:hypothetical protein
VELSLIRKPNIVQRYLIILSPFSECLSVMFVLNCKLRQHCHFIDKNSDDFSMFVAPIVWVSLSYAAAFLVELLGLLSSATLTALMFFRERIDEGRRRFLFNTEASLLHWLYSL